MAAATREFALHGIAGARMDRVAADAASSKERIYAYFGNKEQLFDAVFSNSIAETMDEAPFDATDLPGYAGRTFDRFTDNPDALRLSTWYRLERPDGIGLRSVLDVNRMRLDALAKAQRDGLLTTDLTPVQLLALIQAMATSWETMNPEFADDARGVGRVERRAAVVAAVRRLVVLD
jgi:AcrR family transcriptional regulator